MLSAAEPIPDLNDLYFFAMVVEHGGFSAAGRALGVPKSRLSKRIAALEDRLGVRMLQRTTRKFTVTEVGQQFYEHCRAVIEEEIEAALAGKKTPQQAMDDAVSRGNEILRKFESTNKGG